MPVASPLVSVMVRAARKCARALARDFGEVENLQVSKKGPADFVTVADLKAEKTLRDELARARPAFGFLLEEGGEVAGEKDAPRFVIDPLDGTTNFLHGIPHFAISIGVERDGALLAGVVYDPLRDEMFWAEKGIGAYVNDRRLRVSARDRLAEALVATGIPFKGREAHPQYPAQLETMMGKVAGVRRMGSAALDLAYVAAGRYEAFWEYGLMPWDLAAGILIVREAGGLVSEIEGEGDPYASGEVLAANGQLHGPIRELLASARGRP